jgi:sugar lactone lactonase YvrE
MNYKYAGLVSTIAGTTFLEIINPASITTDGTNLYEAENYAAKRIHKIVISTGKVSSPLNGRIQYGGNPTDFFCGITTDGIDLFLANMDANSVTRFVISTGTSTTIAGTISAGSSDGTGTFASFSGPRAITTDGQNLYVADTGNNTIRQIVISTGTVTTLAGTAGVTGSSDGIGAAALFFQPAGITTDGINLYVVDTGNNSIRKIVTATGVVTTIAGEAGTMGSADGIGAEARFNYPHGITMDDTNLYVADTGNNTIRKIVIATGVVTTFAGTTSSGSADGIGSLASFNSPSGITTDGINLYVTDTHNGLIRKIVLSAAVFKTHVTTLAGLAGSVGSTDGSGDEARFNSPMGITTDGQNLYVADTGNNTIRQIVISTGTVTTLAGTAGVTGSTDGIGAAAQFSHPQGIATDGTNLYVADTSNCTIRKIVIATGEVTTLAGTAGICGKDIVTDGTSLYVTEFFGYVSKIVISTGAVSTVKLHNLQGITFDGTNVYVFDFQPIANSTIFKIDPSFKNVSTFAYTVFNFYGITSDSLNLYLTNHDNTIYKMNISTKEMTVLAGKAQFPGAFGGSGAMARFDNPIGITTDGVNLYVVDTGSNTIRKIQ